jgi:hypothetical protein
VRESRLRRRKRKKIEEETERKKGIEGVVCMHNDKRVN